jgi:hypothetical protein
MKNFQETLAGPRRNTCLIIIGVIIVIIFLLLLLLRSDFAREKMADIKTLGWTDLSFEHMMFESGQLLFDGKYIPGRIEVVAGNQIEPNVANRWMSEEIRSKILAADFSHYFVLIAMMGDMGTPGFGIKVKKIWQNESRIYVKAEFVFPETGALLQQVITSPKHFVKVSKEKMPAFGKIDFRLADEFGKEWANSTFEIPPYLK